MVTASARSSFVGRTASLVQGAKDQGHFKAIMNSIGILSMCILIWAILTHISRHIPPCCRCFVDIDQLDWGMEFPRLCTTSANVGQGFFHNLNLATPQDSSNNLLHYVLILLIVGVPVGLPVVTTTTLAVGAAYLAKEKAIVQKLTAIESLAVRPVPIDGL